MCKKTLKPWSKLSWKYIQSISNWEGFFVFFIHFWVTFLGCILMNHFILTNLLYRQQHCIDKVMGVWHWGCQVLPWHGLAHMNFGGYKLHLGVINFSFEKPGRRPYGELLSTKIHNMLFICTTLGGIITSPPFWVWGTMSKEDSLHNCCVKFIKIQP